jgi:DNA modification methylase
MNIYKEGIEMKIMSYTELLKGLEKKKESLQRLLCETEWNEKNIKSMYNICNIIKNIEITIENLKEIKFELCIK